MNYRYAYNVSRCLIWFAVIIIHITPIIAQTKPVLYHGKGLTRDAFNELPAFDRAKVFRNYHENQEFLFEYIRPLTYTDIISIDSMIVALADYIHCVKDTVDVYELSALRNTLDSLAEIRPPFKEKRSLYFWYTGESVITEIIFRHYNTHGRVSVLNMYYKEKNVLDRFLPRYPQQELDAMLANARQRGMDSVVNVLVSYGAKSAAPVPASLTPATTQAGPVSSADSMFVKRDLEGKVEFLSLMVKMPALFSRFYGLMRPGEKDSSTVAAENLCERVRLLGKTLNHTQETIDVEVQRYIVVKQKLQELKGR